MEGEHPTQALPPSALAVNEGQIAGLPRNPRLIRDARYEKLKQSLTDSPEFMNLRPVIAVSQGEGKPAVVICGNMRLRACIDLGWEEIPTIVLPADTDPAKLREYAIKDNVPYGETDWDILADEWDTEELSDWGFEMPDGWGAEPAPPAEGDPDPGKTLSERYVIPPFTVLDTRKGYWQERKRMWRGMIGDTGESREDTGIASLQMKYRDIYSRSRKERETLGGISLKEYIEKYVSPEEMERENRKVFAAGTSLFDPVLAEICFRWFVPQTEGARVFDPFAGDTQKGFVFGYLGGEFTGVELRRGQIEANERVLEGRGLKVSYICDDGQNVAAHIPPASQDLLFSCPPYFDLEVYSDDPRDASNQSSYGDFIGILENAFRASVGCLKDDRFAVIVVSDVRSRGSGFYHDLCGDVKRMFREAGMGLLNEMILVECLGSKGIGANVLMRKRKVTRVHQNVLVFYKGDPTRIGEVFPEVGFSEDDAAWFCGEFAEEGQ